MGFSGVRGFISSPEIPWAEKTTPPSQAVQYRNLKLESAGDTSVNINLPNNPTFADSRRELEDKSFFWETWRLLCLCPGCREDSASQNLE